MAEMITTKWNQDHGHTTRMTQTKTTTLNTQEHIDKQTGDCPISVEKTEVVVQQILNKCGSVSWDSIAEELESDVEKNMLIDQRDKMFVHLKATLDLKLRDNGYLDENQTTNLEMTKKTKACHSITFAKEIVRMFEYIKGVTNTFPKEFAEKGV